MRWTDMTEKDMIKAWAGEEYNEILKEEILSEVRQDSESYWSTCDAESDIAEYGFENLPELKTALEQKLSEPYYRDLLLPLTIAALKEKAEGEIDGVVRERQGGELVIPEFVYTF